MRALKRIPKPRSVKVYGLAPFLPDQIHFVHSQELLARFPDVLDRGRERAIAKNGAVFPGEDRRYSRSAERDGHRHDNTRAGLRDWAPHLSWATPGLNGDITVWNPVLGRCV